MSGEINMAGIRRLAESGKRSKIGQLRSIRNEIEKVINAGVSLDSIVTELNEQGMELTLATFKMMLYRLRKESKGYVTNEAVGNEISDSINSNPVAIRDLTTPMPVTKREVNPYVVNSVAPVLQKSQPGEPKRFNWEELRKTEGNWS